MTTQLQHDERTEVGGEGVGGEQGLGGEQELGQKIAGRYRIEVLIGAGGMGAVYRAYDEALGEQVALKLLIDGGDCAKRVEWMRREVRLARRVAHPNIARVYDLGHADGLHFLTMEYVEGETLQQLLRREGPLSLARGLELALELCAGLRAIHACGVIHRDLKPANILVACSGRVVIADFGIACACDDEVLATGVIGTPGYMAPEQGMIGEVVDARADIFSLGVVLFSMFSGEHPARVLTQVLDACEGATRLPRLTEVVAGIPPALDSLVSACLSRRASERPREVALIEHALGELSRELAGVGLREAA